MTTVGKFRLPNGDPLYDTGSEALIWADPDDPKCLIKVFRAPGSRKIQARPKADSLRLTELLTISDTIRPSSWLELSTNTSWLIDIDGENDAVQAIKIARAPDDFYLTYEDQFGVATVPQELSFLISDALRRPGLRTVPYTDISFEDRVEIAFSFATTMERLWDIGLAFTDISARNILWTISKLPRAFLIDIESAVKIGQKGITSPDWLSHPSLGWTVNANRSQAALVIWRIFDVRLTSLPTDNPSSPHSSKIGNVFRQTLIDLWKQGEDSQWEHCMQQLQNLRNAKYQYLKINDAVASGYARLVLEQESTGLLDSQILDAATQQLRLELEIEKRITQSQKRHRRIPPSISGFEFDLQPALDSTQPFVSLHEQLFYGDYEGVVEKTLNSSNSSHIILRDHALRVLSASFQTKAERPAIDTVEEQQVLRWSWPSFKFVTQAQISVRNANGYLAATKTIRRADGPGRARIVQRSSQSSRQILVELQCTPANSNNPMVFADWTIQLPPGSTTDEHNVLEEIEHQERHEQISRRVVLTAKRQRRRKKRQIIRRLYRWIRKKTS